MAKPAARILFLEAVLLASGTAILARSFWLQVVHYNVWADKAANSRETDRDVPARRGRIYDRNGKPLAVSHEQYRLHITLDQVRDPVAVKATVFRELKVPKARVDEEFAKPYPYFYGPFGAEQVESLRGLRGVRFGVIYTRQYPMKSLADRVLGRFAEDSGVGIEGMERALDALLQGRAGREHFLKDNKGNRIPAPGATFQEAVAGQDVRLTIDADLQGIAEGALHHAVSENKARGGDIVIVAVHTGEVLAAASLRTDTATGKIVSTSSAIVEPNQPGSTSKIFTVAAMLRFGSDTTPVDGEGGHWLMPVGAGTLRTIDDVHRLHGPVTVGMAVKFSSNIAMSKFSVKLRSEQQFEAIRDFGFGTSPGLGFPGESPGTLYLPSTWVNPLLSQPSLAMGYEWAASALQIALGYAAIANRGVLMAPTLVREVRDEGGVVTWRSRPDTVRRAVPDSVAGHLMAYLHLTEDSGGTGAEGQLDRIRYPGKTGTAKIKTGGYRASFVGIFPEQQPQVVVYVMIDRPSAGEITGGKVAAPVVRHVLQQALLSTRSPLDRTWLTERSTSLAGAVVRPESVSVRRVAIPVVQPGAPAALVAIPSLAGLPARQAILALERAGFQVRLIGRASVRATVPMAGDSLPRGAVVTIHADSLP